MKTENIKEKLIIISCFVLMLLTATFVIVQPVRAETDYTGVLNEINDRVSVIQSFKDNISEKIDTLFEYMQGNNQLIFDTLLVISEQFNLEIDGSFANNLSDFQTAMTDSLLAMNRNASAVSEDASNIKSDVSTITEQTKEINEQIQDLNALTISGNECLTILADRAQTDITNAELMEELNDNLFDLNTLLTELTGYMAYFFGFMILIIVVVSFKAVWYLFDKYILKHTLL